MGLIADSLKPPSAYRVKKDNPDLWHDLVDRIRGAVLPVTLDEIEDWIDARPLDLPAGWAGDLMEEIERQREALEAENISSILMDRFDFT